ncbi:hypothetical protein FJT64_019743 [Amphibalanus amphitrite]|uniref:Uncharacterized protein n=1 Tax=Amphibalanus amphitrite TaxID=1232801 RepID=A0A6A4X3V4_AMPAM|nr:hypothetical protein FJT64_019743 [Amphibalanus amphitrite]
MAGRTLGLRAAEAVEVFIYPLLPRTKVRGFRPETYDQRRRFVNRLGVTVSVAAHHSDRRTMFERSGFLEDGSAALTTGAASCAP